MHSTKTLNDLDRYSIFNISQQKKGVKLESLYFILKIKGERQIGFS